MNKFIVIFAFISFGSLLSCGQSDDWMEAPDLEIEIWDEEVFPKEGFFLGESKLSNEYKIGGAYYGFTIPLHPRYLYIYKQVNDDYVLLDYSYSTGIERIDGNYLKTSLKVDDQYFVITSRELVSFSNQSLLANEPFLNYKHLKFEEKGYYQFVFPYKIIDDRLYFIHSQFLYSVDLNTFSNLQIVKQSTVEFLPVDQSLDHFLEITPAGNALLYRLNQDGAVSLMDSDPFNHDFHYKINNVYVHFSGDYTIYLSYRDDAIQVLKKQEDGFQLIRTETLNSSSHLSPTFQFTNDELDMFIYHNGIEYLYKANTRGAEAAGSENVLYILDDRKYTVYNFLTNEVYQSREYDNEIFMISRPPVFYSNHLYFTDGTNHIYQLNPKGELESVYYAEPEHSMNFNLWGKYLRPVLYDEPVYKE